MIRFIIIAIAFAFIYFLIKGFFQSSNSKKCRKCEGQGYWRGTRGEKNHCKACNGTGEVLKNLA